MFTLFSTAYANEMVAPSPISGFIPLILIFTIFYFFIIRPQQKKIKDHHNMVNNLAKGDIIVTSGGIYGKISKIDKEILDVEIANEVIVKIARSTIAEKSDKKIKYLAEEKTKKTSKKKK